MGFTAFASAGIVSGAKQAICVWIYEPPEMWKHLVAGWHSRTLGHLAVRKWPSLDYRSVVRFAVGAKLLCLDQFPAPWHHLLLLSCPSPILIEDDGTSCMAGLVRERSNTRGYLLGSLSSLRRGLANCDRVQALWAEGAQFKPWHLLLACSQAVKRPVPERLENGNPEAVGSQYLMAYGSVICSRQQQGSSWQCF